MTTQRTLDARAMRRLLATWFALAVVMSANGIFREVVLRPLLGDGLAPVVSAALGIALLLLVTRRLFPPLAWCSTRTLAAVSAALVVATVAFETALGLLVDGKTWPELLAHYALWQGELWPIVLGTLAATPFAWGRWWPGGYPLRRLTSTPSESR